MSNKKFQWNDSLVIEYSNTLFAFSLSDKDKLKQFKDSKISKVDWKTELSNKTKLTGVFKE